MTVIDAHHHLWDARLHPQPWLDAADARDLPRHATADEFSRAVAATAVSASICVQAGPSPDETRWLLDAARRSSVIAGVVMQRSLADTGGGPALIAAADAEGGGPPPLVGVRDPALLRRGTTGDRVVRANLDLLAERGLPLDVLATPAELRGLGSLARSHPSTTFVLDHIGYPPLTAGRRTMGSWARGLGALARCPNVVAKLSGLPPASDRPGDPVSFATVHAIEVFGPRRLMLGSDWPVTTRSTGYRPCLERLTASLAGLSPADQDAIRAATARTVYLRDTRCQEGPML